MITGKKIEAIQLNSVNSNASRVSDTGFSVTKTVKIS